MINEPWDRKRWRLGLLIGGAVGVAGQRSPGKRGIGYVGVELRPPATIARGVDQVQGDPVDAALVRARQSVAEGAERVTLYRYTARRFPKSRAAADGMTRHQHDALIDRTGAALAAEGIPFDVELVA